MHEHHENYSTNTPDATGPDDPVLRRLIEAANDLLADGSLPYQIETIVYDGLAADTAEASLFRAGAGLTEPPTRDFASRLAELIGRALRGPHDPEFARRYTIAHVRGRLAQAAHDCAEQLRRDDAPVTRENLELRLMLAAMRHGPEAKYLLGNQVDISIEGQCGLAANDYFAMAAVNKNDGR